MKSLRSLRTTCSRVRFTIGEALMGIVFLAVPLAFWATELHKLSDHTNINQSNPSAALLLRAANKLKAINITYCICTFLSTTAYFKLLVLRRAKATKSRITGHQGDSFPPSGDRASGACMRP